MREDEIKILWEGFSGTLIEDGQNKFFVIFPGILSNVGPDFKNAIIVVNGVKIVGEAECHSRSSDWFKHNHHINKEFSSVKFHIIWEEDVKLDGIVINLQKVKSLNRNFEFLCVSDEGARRREIKRLGEVRLKRKSKRIAERLQEKPDKNSVLYEFVSEALGYEKYKVKMLEFSRRVPYDILIRLDNNSLKETVLEGIFAEADVKNLHPFRPANAPVRRILTLKKLFEKYPNISDTVQKLYENKENYKTWERTFKTPGLGSERFKTIMANVLIPFLLNFYPEDEIFSFFSNFPPEEENRFLREAKLKLKFSYNNAIEGQGLLELFLTRCSKYLCFACPLRRPLF